MLAIFTAVMIYNSLQARRVAEVTLLEELRSSAKVACDKARAVNPGQGLDVRLAELEPALTDAEAALERGAQRKARLAYEEILIRCGSIFDLDKAREAALAHKKLAEKAKQLAESMNNAKDIENELLEANRAFPKASAEFERGQFVIATKGWKEAADKYVSAQAHATIIQSYSKAKHDFESSLVQNRELLERYGGEKWKDVQERLLSGELKSPNLEVGKHAYGMILDQLFVALNEAKSAKKAEMDRIERLESEKKAQEALLRASRVAVALAAAWQAKAESKWKEVVIHANKALEIQADNEEALTLKNYAERQQPVFVMCAQRRQPRTREMAVINGQLEVTFEKEGFCGETMSSANAGLLPWTTKTFVDSKGIEHEFRIEEKRERGERINIEGTYNYTSPWRGKFIDYVRLKIQCDSKKEQRTTEKLVTYVSKQGAGNQRYSASERGEWVHVEQSFYVDLQPLRFVFVRSENAETVYFFVFRLDKGEVDVPTTVAEPEKMYTDLRTELERKN
jgi:tetratricopeptide (TPR) repeat protein